MPFLATPNGIKIVLEAIQNGIPVVNIFHCKTAGAVTPTDLQEVADSVEQWVIDDLLPIQHSSWTATTLTVTDISVANGQQVIVPLGVGYEGQVSGTAAAGNAATVISWRTAYTGRSYRGRTFMGGMPQSALLTAQNVTTAYQAQLAGLATSLIDALATAGYVLSVLSTVFNLAQRAAGVLTEIVSVIVDSKVDSQRRRTAN